MNNSSDVGSFSNKQFDIQNYFGNIKPTKWDRICRYIHFRPTLERIWQDVQENSTGIEKNKWDPFIAELSKKVTKYEANRNYLLRLVTQIYLRITKQNCVSASQRLQTIQEFVKKNFEKEQSTSKEDVKDRRSPPLSSSSSSSSSSDDEEEVLEFVKKNKEQTISKGDVKDRPSPPPSSSSSSSSSDGEEEVSGSVKENLENENKGLRPLSIHPSGDEEGVTTSEDEEGVTTSEDEEGVPTSEDEEGDSTSSSSSESEPENEQSFSQPEEKKPPVVTTSKSTSNVIEENKIKQEEQKFSPLLTKDITLLQTDRKKIEDEFYLLEEDADFQANRNACAAFFKEIEKQPSERNLFYTNLLCLEPTRVQVKGSDGNDLFVHANRAKIGGKDWIFSQAPASKTFAFWQMIWNHSTLIVKLTKNIDNNSHKKCTEYFCNRIGETYSTKENDTKDALAYSIKTTHIETLSDYSIYTLVLTRQQGEKEECKNIQLIDYYAWPDESVPDSTNTFFELEHKINSLAKETTAVIHCSGGIGRTGFVLCYKLLEEEIERQRKQQVPVDKIQVDMKQILKKARLIRAHVIQTARQYVYLYEVGKDLLLRLAKNDIEEKKPVSSSNPQSARQKNGASSLNTDIKVIVNATTIENKEELNKKFTELNKNIIPQPNEYKFSSGLTKNVVWDQKVPFLNHNSYFEDKGIFAHANTATIEKKHYIFAQGPAKGKDDKNRQPELFIEMLMDSNCTHAVQLVKEGLHGDESCLSYLPSRSRTITIGPYTLTEKKPLQRLDSQKYVIHSIYITKQEGTQEGKEIVVYQYTGWSNNQPQRENVSSFLAFMEVTSTLIGDFPSEKLPVFCGLYPLQSGIYIAWALMREKLNQFKAVNQNLSQQEKRLKFNFDMADIMKQVRGIRAYAINTYPWFEFLCQMGQQMILDAFPLKAEGPKKSNRSVVPPDVNNNNNNNNNINIGKTRKNAIQPLNLSELHLGINVKTYEKGIKEDFKILDGQTTPQKEQCIVLDEMNKRSNVSANHPIFPNLLSHNYASTRVHANSVQIGSVRYILSFAPMPEKPTNNWAFCKMLWENNVSVVVKLIPTEEIEAIEESENIEIKMRSVGEVGRSNALKDVQPEKKKQNCANYLPEEGARITYTTKEVDLPEEYSLRRKKKEDYAGCDIHTLLLQRAEARQNSTKEIQVIDYKDWPTGKMPSTDSFLKLLKQTDQLTKGKVNPVVVVHCDRGLGPTGVFAFCKMVQEQAERFKEKKGPGKEFACLINETFTKLRNQRAGAIETEEQFYFAIRFGKAIIEKVFLGDNSKQEEKSEIEEKVIPNERNFSNESLFDVTKR